MTNTSYYLFKWNRRYLQHTILIQLDLSTQVQAKISDIVCGCSPRKKREPVISDD